MLKILLLQIYPYWNVNLSERNKAASELALQIYPYWNVNRLKEQVAQCADLASNLSILECKYDYLWDCFNNRQTSNLSILECKYYNGVEIESKSNTFKSIHTGM